MREDEAKKAFKEIADKCELGGYRQSNVSSMLDAFAAIEHSQRLDKKKKHPFRNFWTTIWKFLNRWFI